MTRRRLGWLIALLCGIGLVGTKISAEDSAPATKKADAPQSGEAKRLQDDEDYELYKSLVDTLDQVERNYVKKRQPPRADGSRHQGRARQARSVLQLHQPRRDSSRFKTQRRKPVRRHRHSDHHRRRPAQGPQPAGRHAGLPGRHAGRRPHREDRRQADRQASRSTKPSSSSRAKPAPASR